MGEVGGKKWKWICLKYIVYIYDTFRELLQWEKKSEHLEKYHSEEPEDCLSSSSLYFYMQM